MSIKFKPGWNIEKSKYKAKYGPYQAFLDSVNEASVINALQEATYHFQAPWAVTLLQEANGQQADVTVEQSTHQPEDTFVLQTGEQQGFTLHLTVRNSQGRAFHLYVMQHNDGTIFINEMSANNNLVAHRN